MNDQAKQENTDTTAPVDAATQANMTEPAAQTTPEGQTKATDEIPPEQVKKLQGDAIEKAKEFAMRGTKTRKEADPDGVVEKAGYDWWENQGSYEGNNWSVSLWDFDNDVWQIQVTKIELQPDGHSLMTSYSIRDENDASFPGFQVYKEKTDNSYRAGAVEDIVYLNRIIQGMIANLH